MVYVDVDRSSLNTEAMYEDRYPQSSFLPQRVRKVAKSATELALLERLTSGRRLLDVGCSYGFFLDTALRRGWQTTGVEVSRSTAAYARATYGLKVHEGMLEDAPLEPGGFDVVTLRHVLEHVSRPRATLEYAHRLLAPGGLLLVAVPNVRSLPARLFGAGWWWIDPPTHLYYFDRDSLGRLMTDCGFRPEHVSTARGDDERLGLYLLFVLNQRLGAARRLRGLAGDIRDRGDGPDGVAIGRTRPPSARRWWAAVRSVVNVGAVALRPVGAALDAAGLGSEVLMVGRRQDQAATQ